MHHVRILLGMLFMVAVAVPMLSHAQEAERCFPETNQCIRGAIRTYWEQNGGLPVFGFPITAQAEAVVEGRTLQVQWFERDRLEIQADGSVTAGRLGAELLERQGRAWETLPQVDSAPDRCLYVPETRHSICEPFLAFWQANGGIQRIGFPISEPMAERIEEQELTVQYFERRRIEIHPDLPNAPLLFGLLGREVYALLQGDPQPPAPPPPPAQPTPPPPSYNGCQPEPNPDAAPNFPIQIVGIDKRAEVVVLTNRSDQPINLDGWRMCSIRGAQLHSIGGVLQGGETRNFANDGGAIWSNTELDDGALYDPEGRLISYWRDN